jgi:hypothetical protein
MNIGRRRRVALTLSLVIPVTTACASLPQKQRAVMTISSVEKALGSVQDFERSAYAAKTIPGLTPAVHGTVSKALSDAFGAQIVAAKAVKAWRAGEPAPTSLLELQGYVDRAFQAVSGMAGTDPGRQRLIAELQAIADTVLQTIGLLKPSTPGKVAA